MEKVKQIWFDIPGATGTGLYLELEDGRFFRHHSTDPIIPFEEVKITPPPSQ